jgi:hypothetical protein
MCPTAGETQTGTPFASDEVGRRAGPASERIARRSEGQWVSRDRLTEGNSRINGTGMRFDRRKLTNARISVLIPVVLATASDKTS